MIEINNKSKYIVDKKFLIGIAKKVLKGENKGKSYLSVALVGPAEIKKLNKKYRGKNKPTDVLAFNNVSCFMLHVSRLDLGEIIICSQVVKSNAKKFNTTFKKELARVLIHGILHLLGYDHEKLKKEAEAMRKKEECYLTKF